MYTPRVPPSAEGDRLRWLVEEFRAINQHLNTKSVPIWRIAQTHVTPDKPRDGDVRYANGTDWEPGAGIGPYIRVDASTAGAARWVPMFARPYEVACYCPDKPTASMIVLLHVFARQIILPANLTGSQGRLNATATAAANFALVRVQSTATASTFGAMSFTTNSLFASFSTTAVTFSAGDTLKVLAPASPDTTASDLAFTFKEAT